MEIMAAQGFRRRHFDTVGSTNADCLEAARHGDAGQLWITGSVQTGGRGRRGRAWVSERGNLYASLLLIDPGPRERLGDLPMVCATALADAVEAATGAYGLVKLKWPNDLLVDGAKISGILLESEMLADGRNAVVCGFGVNCAHHPSLPNYLATDLAELGYRIDPDALFDRLATAMAQRLAIWGRGTGFAPIRMAWLERAAGLGEPIVVRLANNEHEGVFRDIDAEGRLVLERAGEADLIISAGDVFFPVGENTRTGKTA